MALGKAAADRYGGQLHKQLTRNTRKRDSNSNDAGADLSAALNARTPALRLALAITAQPEQMIGTHPIAALDNYCAARRRGVRRFLIIKEPV